MGRQLGDLPLLERDPPGADRQEAHDAFDGGGLPRAIPADEANGLPGIHRQRDSLENVSGAPKGIDALKLEHAREPPGLSPAAWLSPARFAESRPVSHPPGSRLRVARRS